MKTITQSTGEFAGWNYWPDEPFESKLVGPFYFRIIDGEVGSAFRAQERHMNLAGVMHGGCLMTFGDFSLFTIASKEFAENPYAVTVGFNAEFLDGPKVGEFVESRGEVLRSGKSLIFVRGIVTAEGRPCLNFSGTIKRIKKPL